MSFYSSITYVLFATSKHLSIGTYAVVSLMVYSTINRLENDYIVTNKYSDFTRSLNNLSREDVNSQNEQHILDFRLRVATSLTFWCGLIQVSF